jgi:hypothetical protein
MGRCKWYQKRVESEMLTRTWLGSKGRRTYGAVVPVSEYGPGFWL